MPKDWKTRLIHTDARVPEGFRSLATPIYRGSTILFDDAHTIIDHWGQPQHVSPYGLYATPTVLELGARVCELEGGTPPIVTAGGQGAIALVNLALLKAGDHVLIPENIYGPHRRLA